MTDQPLGAASPFDYSVQSSSKNKIDKEYLKQTQPGCPANEHLVLLACVTLENLINALNRPETPCHGLRRCVSKASPEKPLLETVRRSFVSETVSETELLVPF